MTEILQRRVSRLLEPVVEALGYELVLVELTANSRHSLLRLYIDTENDITVQDCERVSHEVAAILDVEDPIKQAYRLEVSSPGLDRPLVKPEHYVRFIGETARVQLYGIRNGRRRFAGILLGCDGDAVSLETPDGVVRLLLDEIEVARLVPRF